MLLHISMIVTGLLVIAAGFRGTFYAGRPWSSISAFLLPAGLITALMGVLLLCVPNFFKN